YRAPETQPFWDGSSRSTGTIRPQERSSTSLQCKDSRFSARIRARTGCKTCPERRTLLGGAVQARVGGASRCSRQRAPSGHEPAKERHIPEAGRPPRERVSI